jgi:RNA polymerase sigma-70 factor (sigma-E family)
VTLAKRSTARTAESWDITPPVVTSDGRDKSDQDRQQFGAFVAQHARGLDRLAFLMLGDEHAAEDLAADTLLAAWQHWGKVGRADNPLAYVRRILVNQASEHYRRRARESTVLGRLRLSAGQAAPEPDSAAVVDVRSALLRLPERRRACLVLRHCFGLTEEDVARTLGISVGTVKSQTSKAAAQFRREIGDAAPTISSVPGPDRAAAGRQKAAQHAG